MTTSGRQWDGLWVNARLATMRAGGAPYGAIDDGAIAVGDGRIAWIGAMSDLDRAASRQVPSFDCGGRWITPGLIDCHTHLVYGGDRAEEFERRLQGATYEEITRAGGGIRSTVAKTRAASEEQLLAAARRRLAALMAEGVTVVEIKSGYGLDLETELKTLRVARALAAQLPVTIRATFLGAHLVPPEFDGRQGAYVDSIVDEMLPAVTKAGLADAVDAFAERIAFTNEETARIFAAARAAGLPVKLHADQLSDGGGAALAARFSALSADHLEHSSEEGIAAMARAGTVAVLLPGAYYFLRETKLPPIEAMRKHGAAIAVATDSNPGTSPALSLLLMLNMACTLFRLTPEEALAGVTRNGAKALGLEESHGTLDVGKAGDFVLWDIGHPAELSYWIAGNPVHRIVRGGKPLHPAGRGGMTELYRFAAGSTPVLISVPHAGTFLPPDIAARMTPAAMALPDTDWHVDRLYDFAGALGIGMIVATHSRCVVDLNRDPSGQPLYPGADNTEVCPTTTFASEPVYAPGAAPDEAEQGERVRRYFRPYHERLEAELALLKQRFGIAVLWDAHSIASEVPRFFAGRLPDLNLGTARGASADPALADRVMGGFAASGFTSILDGRFTGGYITRHYGRPSEGVHAIQLEMAQIVYMEERPPYRYRDDLAARIRPVLDAALSTVRDWAWERARG